MIWEDSMKEYKLQPKNLPAYIRILSGYFNLTKKEQQVLTAIIHILNEVETEVITREVKIEIANFCNFKLQVVTNYINLMKKKGCIKSNNTLHPILTSNKVVIEYE